MRRKNSKATAEEGGRYKRRPPRRQAAMSTAYEGGRRTATVVGVDKRAKKLSVCVRRVRFRGVGVLLVVLRGRWRGVLRGLGRGRLRARALAGLLGRIRPFVSPSRSFFRAC